jgi:hypothetical protein
MMAMTTKAINRSAWLLGGACAKKGATPSPRITRFLVPGKNPRFAKIALVGLYCVFQLTRISPTIAYIS